MDYVSSFPFLNLLFLCTKVNRFFLPPGILQERRRAGIWKLELERRRSIHSVLRDSNHSATCYSPLRSLPSRSRSLPRRWSLRQPPPPPCLSRRDPPPSTQGTSFITSHIDITRRELIFSREMCFFFCFSLRWARSQREIPPRRNTTSRTRRRGVQHQWRSGGWRHRSQLTKTCTRCPLN